MLDLKNNKNTCSRNVVMSQGCVRVRTAVCEAVSWRPVWQESGHRLPVFLGLPKSYITARQPGGRSRASRGRCFQRGMLRKDLEGSGSSPGQGMFSALGPEQKPHSEGASSLENKPGLSPGLVLGAYQGEPCRCGAPGIEWRAAHRCQAGR
uniref:Uncharacterized protein n=1 Tax=Pipistrellus kuhlii TaxID=59472 RepID=A0A7J7TW29_PIPKU|nr:hypothetical protein mPipKuh1_009277 [Pipistrellus kuhlii]